MKKYLITSDYNKMNKTFILIGSILAAIILLFGGVYLNSIRQGIVLSGVQDGQAYNSTSTSSTFSTGTSFQLLKTGGGTLGSVVVTLGSASPLQLYDATTTVNGGVYGTTTLVNFPTTATAGTYVFDSVFSRGLIVTIPSTVGVASTTITWR